MTPLAQRFANEVVLAPKDRTLVDPDGILRLMPDASCFEMTEVADVVSNFGNAYIDAGVPDPKLAFLPHRLTWLEWMPTEPGPDGKRRRGFMLEDSGDDFAIIWYLGPQGARIVGKMALGNRLEEAMDDRTVPFIAYPHDNPQLDERKVTVWAFILYGMLAVINSPRQIGRRTHTAHSGLARKLAKAKMLGKPGPLRPWTEIKLEWMPEAEDDQAPKESRLTG